MHARIAVIADIHGNLPVPEAVLADIERRDVDRTINLGDCVSGPLWPREVCDLLMARDDLTIRGNHDRWVSGPDPASMGRRIDTLAAILTRITALARRIADLGRCWIMAFRLSRHARRMTTSISSRRCRKTDWCEHIHQRSGHDWEMFRLVWCLCGHSHRQHCSNCPTAHDLKSGQRRLPVL